MAYKTKEQARLAWQAYRAAKLPYVQKVCQCGALFSAASNVQKRCNECRSRQCHTCMEKFIPPDGKTTSKYCSRRCKDASQKNGEPIWLKANRGVKPRTYHLRHRDKHGSAADREWRTKVFERDSFTCQMCRQKGKRLQAHHIKPFKEFPELRHVLENGQTLCVECHKKTDSFGWSSYWSKKIAAKRLAQEVLF